LSSVALCPCAVSQHFDEVQRILGLLLNWLGYAVARRRTDGQGNVSEPRGTKFDMTYYINRHIPWFGNCSGRL